MPKKKPSEPLECRICFQTSFRQDRRIDVALVRKKVSKAEWLRQAVETQLKRQKL